MNESSDQLYSVEFCRSDVAYYYEFFGETDYCIFRAAYEELVENNYLYEAINSELTIKFDLSNSDVRNKFKDDLFHMACFSNRRKAWTEVKKAFEKLFFPLALVLDDRYPDKTIYYLKQLKIQDKQLIDKISSDLRERFKADPGFSIIVAPNSIIVAGKYVSAVKEIYLKNWGDNKLRVNCETYKFAQNPIIENKIFESINTKTYTLDAIKKAKKELAAARKYFAGMGTRRVKLGLNKMVSEGHIVAQAVREAIEIEDINLNAKIYPLVEDEIYPKKQKHILRLSDIFREAGWVYGIKPTNLSYATHQIFFEIPGCDQLCWHFNPEYPSAFPVYSKDWDGKNISRLRKLAPITTQLLAEGYLNSTFESKSLPHRTV